MTGNGNKKKFGIVAIASILITLLAVLYAGIILWTGGWAGIGPSLCQKPGTPLIWFFGYTKDDRNHLHAFGNDKLKCTVSFQPHGKEWQPFALSWYRLDNKGMCLKSPIVEDIYNFKQGASAIHPSYRLDTLLEKPFYTGIDPRQFAFSGSYCDDDYDNPGCLVAMAPVCVKSPVNAQILPAEPSMCRQPGIKTRSIVSGHGSVDDMAAIMLANEKAHGNQGFRYSLVQHVNGLQGGLAIAEASGGRVRCYYRKTQYSHVEFDGNILATSEASHEQGMAACMAVLADRNRYCSEPATLPPEIIY